MMVIDLALFGFIGLTIWAVQMMWIPFFAAGIINGVGHYWGYRNFQCRRREPQHRAVGHPDRRRRAAQQSPRLSLLPRSCRTNGGSSISAGCTSASWRRSGFAKVKKVAPKVTLATGKTQCDQDTLQAVITNRYDVLARYARSLKQTCAEEIAHLKARAVRVDRSMVKRWLHIDADSTAPSSNASA